MASQSTSASVLAPELDRERPPVPISFFAHTAALEFHAALHLLAERARFLTAASEAAIAVKREGMFTYAAVTGDSAAEAGTNVDLSKKYLSECVRLGKNFRTRTESSFTLAVPIMRGVEVVGIFELLGRSAFGDRDEEHMSRLAEMVSTALDHREAAERAEKVDFKLGCEETSESSVAAAPSRWHAAEIEVLPGQDQPIENKTVEHKSVPIASAVAIQKCSSCGFPVSTGRKLCVDCDKITDIAPEPVELFSTPAEETWISAHGYTIASLLLSVAAVAFVVWLRAR